VCVQTSGSPVPEDTFKVQIPVDGIMVDSTAVYDTAFPAAPETITIAQGGQMGSAVLISEIQAQGATDTDEFIELYNRRDYAVDLSNYSLQYSAGTGQVSNSSPASKLNLSGMIQANGYLLIANSDGYDGASAADISYTTSNFDLSHVGGTVFLVNTQDALMFPQSGSIENRVAWGSVSGSGALYPEGSAAPAPVANGSLERKAFSDSTPSSMASGGIDATMGNSYTSDDNANDFISRTTAEPQNTSSDTESSELSEDYPVVINEFLYNGAAQWIELYNNSEAPVEIANWELEAAGTDYIIPATASGSATSISAGGYVTIHWNADGTNTATDITDVHLYTGAWTALGTLAGDIYLLNAAASGQDYVQYGGSGQVNEQAAATAGQWASGMFVDGGLYGNSLGRGTNGYDSNMVWDWQVFSTPSVGAANSGGDSFAPEPVTNVTLADQDTTAWGIDGGDVTVSWTPNTTADTSFDYYEIYLLQDGVDLDVYNHSPFETVFDGQFASSRTGSSWRMSDSAGQALETGNYKAYVRAVDFAQNRSAAIASAVGTLTSETDLGEMGADTSPPMIMSMPGKTAKAGANAIFFAEVSDDRAVAGAALNWRVSGGTFAAIAAEAVGTSGLYKMTLPWDGSWSTSTVIDYYLSAWDTADNDLALTNYSYFTVNPQFDMDQANQDADSATLTGAATNAFSLGFRDASAYTRSISGTVYDSAGSAIQNANVFIPGSGLDSVLSASTGTYSFAATVADGSYDVFAMATGYGQLSINGVMVHAGTPSSTANDFYLSTGAGGRGGDTQKGFVMWTEPGEGMMGSPTDISSSAAPIVAHLSETMDGSSINDHNAADAGSNIYLTTTGQDRVAGQVTYDESNNDPRIIFSSDTALSSNTTYRFVITSAVKDAAGNAIESNQPDGSWAMEFTTFADFQVGGTFQGDGYSMEIEYGKGMGYPPYVTGTMPSPGAFNVPTNSKLTVTFSEAMDASTIESTNSTGTGIRLYDLNYQNSGSGEYVTISVDLDDATRTVATITRRINDGAWADGLLEANHQYAVRVMGSAQNSSGITMADPSMTNYEQDISYQGDFDTGSNADTSLPQIMGLNLEMYQTGSGAISSAGTLVNVPTTLHTIEIGFDKNMDPSTITRNNITLKRGTTLIAGTVEYRPLDRMATFSPSAALAPSTDYTLQISTSVTDLTGQALAADYYAVFTTSDQVDSESPFVSFGTASDYMLAVTFSEPMNAARTTDTTKWGSSVLNPANYTLWRADGPPPHTIGQNLFAYTGNGLTSGDNGDMAEASGVTIKYDVDSFTATLEGLQLPMPGGFMIFVNDVTDISGNTIVGNIAAPPDASFASAYGQNATGGPVEDSSDTGKMMGSGGMGMMGAGGQGMDMHMMGMTPTSAMPMSMLAGVTTTYMVDVPLSTAISAGGSIVLTFPSGFDISGAKNADPTGEYIHGDINGPGPGVVVLSTASETSGGLDDDGVTVNTQARTVTITLGAVPTQANDYITLDIAGIVNSKLPKSFDTSGYTVDIQTMANSNVLETMSNVMPFFLMPGGDYKISGTVTFPETVTGTVSLFGGSPMTGPIEQEITFDGTGSQASYEMTSLTAGEYFLMTDPMVTMGSTDYFGLGMPEPIWITNADVTKDFTFSLPNAGLGLDVQILGDFSAGTGKDADVDIFAGSPTGFAVKTVTLDQDYSVTPYTATLYLPSAGSYRVGIGPAMPKGPMITDGPLEMKFTPPPDINVEVSSGGNWTESSGTANDGTVSFTVGTSLSITGYVMSSDTDYVANAEVYAYNPMGMFGTQTSSAKDGSFSLNLPEGMYNAGAMLPGMPPSIETVFEVRMVAGSPTIYVGGRPATEVFGSNELIIKLNKPDRTISGKVTDGTNLVSYAPVWAYQTDGPGHADTMTDSSGNYILYVSAGTWNIGSYVPGFGDLDEKTGVAVTATDDVANVNFAPDASATYVTISGNVSINSVAQSNMPIRAVEIDANGNFTGYQGNSQTNSNGDYSIKIKGTDGTAKHYRVDIWTPEYGEVAANSGTGLSQAPTWDQPWNVAITTSDVVDVDIVVAAADLTTLTITFTGGTADMQAYIDLMQIDPSNLNPMGTGRHFEVRDLSGTTTIDLPAGAYHAFAHIPGYGDFNPTEAQSAPYYLDLSSGSPTATFNLGAISTATVTGTVLDDSDDPVADAHIHVGDPQTGVFYDTTTGSDGTYSLTMKAGTYFAGAEKKGYISEPKTITIAEGSNPNTNLTLASTSLKITGYVYVDQAGGTDNVYDTGEEITDAFVSAKQIASSSSSGGFAGVDVGLDGAYELYVSAGDWQVFAVADEYEEAPYASNPVTVAGSNVPNINIRLSSATTLVAPKNTTFKPAQGTTFDHPDAGLKLTLPPNAIGTGSTDYKVAATQTSKLPTTTNASVIGGKGQDITINDSSGAAVTTLSDSITIEQTFTKAELIAGGITTLADVEKIVMAYWDESASAYKALPTTIAYDPVTVTDFADLVSVTYTGSTEHLSVFAPILPKDGLAPSPPTSVSATAGSNQVSLTWTAPTTNTDSSALGDLLGYEVYRSTSVAGTYTQVNTSDVTSTSYTDTTAVDGTAYYYKVTAADTGGNESAKSSASSAATPVSDTTAPTITSVTSTTVDGSYNAGDAINVTVTFSEAVTLAGGNLVITLETGTTDRTVTISSISSATTASGTYTVQAGDKSSDLTVSSIALSAGTLSDAASNTMSAFTPATNLAAGSALVVDTTAPTITSVTSTTANGSYAVGGAINVTVTFSEAVTLAGGNLVITLETGTSDRTVSITSISSATTASGTYTVQAGDASADLTVSSLALSAGTLSDVAGNNLSDFTPGTNLAAGSAIVVVTATPTSSSVEQTWTAPADDANGSILGTVDETDNTFTVQARAKEEVNSTSTNSPTPFIYVAIASAPTPAPPATVTGPKDGEYLAGGSSHTITWSVTDTDTADTSVTISYYNGSDWVEITAGAANDGSHTWTVPNLNIANAKVKVTKVTGEDKTATSNSEESNATFTIDSTTPSATVDALLTSDWTPELTGTVDDPDATIDVTVNGKTYRATNNGDGSWSLPDNTIDSALPPGTYDVVVTVTDLAGNVSTEEIVDALRTKIELLQGAREKTSTSVGCFISSILLCNLLNSSVLKTSASSSRRRRAIRSKDCRWFE